MWWSVQDDAGVKRRVRLPWLLLRERGFRRRLPLEVVLPLGAMGVVPLTVGVGAWTAGPFVVAITLFSPIAASLILLHVTLLVWVASGLRAYTARVVRLRVGEGVCPSCLYEMGGAGEGEQKGTTRCPECGALWDADVGEAKRVVVKWNRGEAERPS